MSFGGSSGGGEAKQARQDEEARQERIRQGTSRINDIFNGSVSGSGAVSGGYDPNKTYYNADGSVWKPQGGTVQIAPTPAAANGKLGATNSANSNWSGGSSGGGGGRSSGGTAVMGYDGGGSSGGGGGRSYSASNPGSVGQQQKPQTRQLTPEEEFLAAQGKLFSGTSKSGGFGDDFFAKRRQSFIDYATPQLEDQYGNAQKELTFALARSGTLDSSIRGEQTGKLQQLYDLNKQKIGDEALSYETQSRNAVEDARANLIQTLNATGDAQGAANSALSRSQALSQPAAYSPLSQLFTDFTAGLGTQAAQERAMAASGGSYKAPYNTGLFGGAGRVKVS